MYWPIGTPRVYASNGSRSLPPISPFHSHDDDGLASPTYPRSPTASTRLLDLPEHEHAAPATPATPSTPTSPNQGLTSSASAAWDTQTAPPTESDQDDRPHDERRPSQPSHDAAAAASQSQAGLHADPVEIPANEPVLAIRVARNGALFASITATSITIWQSRPAVVIAAVVRSASSLKSYGNNVDLLLRPDSAILVVRTSLGYLITYSLATDTEARVYKAHFSSYSNVQRRRQSHVAAVSGLPADQFLLGPGEGGGVPDISVRFRMVIKVDAGIASALALDDELVVATRKPAAVQCIRWTPDKSGSQTRTELLSRMGWTEKRASITDMTHDRPMNLSTWVTSDGRAYAVQKRATTKKDDTATISAEEAAEASAEAKKLFRGHCFHVPSDEHDGRATKAVINARFSLIAVGCEDGSVRVYSARDYVGNIPHSHTYRPPAPTAGSLTILTYSPDGYCLFAGYNNGWAMWSVYGKPLGSSFGSSQALNTTRGEEWLSGVRDAAWVGGGSEIMLVGPDQASIWVLEMARSAFAGCYSSANLMRPVLQTSTSIMVYRGDDLPDLATISTEPFLWHTSHVPAPYLATQWPIRCVAASPDGRYVAVAGRRGLAHYSVNSGRWRTFATEEMENEFQVRGGMCWYQHLLVAAVDANKSYELRLFSRESALDVSLALHIERMSSPAVLIASAGEDSLLVYTHENVLHHFIFASGGGSIRLVQVGQIGFHGIVRSPARVRGLSWLVPESQLLDGDPSSDVTTASVLFLVDGKLVLLRPSVNDQGQLRYDMRVVAHNVEFHANMSDLPPRLIRGHPYEHAPDSGPGLGNSLWTFDGTDLQVWTSMDDLIGAPVGSGNAAAAAAAAGSIEVPKEIPSPVPVAVDFYPLSILLSKGIALGVESELVQRRDVGFSHLRFCIRTQLFLPDILRSFLSQSKKADAARLAQIYQGLAYFPHALEVLLHRVLDEEVDTAPKPEEAVLPRVLSLLSSFKEYLDIVLQCTRKTEVRQWQTLFGYLPPAQELFEESLQRGSLKTAGGFLIILHTLEELSTASEQCVRLLSRAMAEKDWDLCKELARFLAAMDDTGDTLAETMSQARALQRGSQADGPARLELPIPSHVNGASTLAGNRGNGQESSDGLPATSDDGSDVSCITSPTAEEQ